MKTDVKNASNQSYPSSNVSDKPYHNAGEPGAEARSNVDSTVSTTLAKIDHNAHTFPDSHFQTIFEAHYPRIQAMNYRMLRNREDAEDITQETFIRAYVNYKKLDPHAPIFAWLCKIATNLCIDVARKNKNIRIVSLETFYEAELLQQRAEHFMKAINLGANIEMEESVVMLNQVLNTLPPHYGQVVVLRGCDGYRAREVADILGISVSAVNTIYYRAKSKFKQLYQELSTQHSV